jgi:hypothetical protein
LEKTQPFRGAFLSEYLDPAEVKTLTASCRVPTQANWLKEHGIPHRLDGRRIIISRVHVQAWLEGKTLRSSNGPNWAALSNA